MTRTVRAVDAGEPRDVFEALRDALAGSGPAVVPREAAESLNGQEATNKQNQQAEPDTVPQNVALVIETSGSTGVPKRVALSADALLASAAASAGAMGGQGQWLLALPAHYVAGAQVLVRSLAAETEPLYYGPGHFDAVRFATLAAALTHDLRYTSLVPVQLARLVEAVEEGATDVAGALRQFDGILVGGQALTSQLRERAERAGARILSTYGSSETAGGCVYDGVPIGTTTVREVGGLLEIGGPTLAEGYLGDEGRTRATFHEADGHRWYRTGDLGRVDDGRVTVFGRADNVIISGGEKVLLDSVELTVRSIPGLDAAIVVASDDDEWGQVPVVVVAADARRWAGPDALRKVRSTVAERVGRAAAPARIVAVDQLPLLSSGKPDRRAAALIVADTDADTAAATSANEA
ncbi:AMP-binding protein [Leifsonia sp. NPDC058194]|uniref:AMP-binding protein n=1 Tax=Leifsonia sp. NPDC058194 TaxID=3346374 RepID=UPI0036DD100C